MKSASTITLILALSASGFAVAQSAGMNHASMTGMQHADASSAAAVKSAPEAKKQAKVHQVAAVVRKAEPAKGSVTLAHEAVPSLKWPAMTMRFTVKDKTLFDKLADGSKVNIDFVVEGSNYIVTAVK